MKLFLATFELRKTKYMGRETKEMKQRLVWAADEEQARAKLDQEYNYSAPGDDSIFVWNAELEEAL